MRKAIFTEELKLKAPKGFSAMAAEAAAQCETTLSEFVRRAVIAKAKELGVAMPMVDISPALILKPAPGSNVRFRAAPTEPNFLCGLLFRANL